MVIRSQENYEVVIFFKDLTHARIHRHDLTCGHVPKLAHKFFAKRRVFGVREHEQMKFRFLQVIEDASPVPQKIWQAIPGLHIVRLITGMFAQRVIAIGNSDLRDQREE